MRQRDTALMRRLRGLRDGFWHIRRALKRPINGRKRRHHHRRLSHPRQAANNRPGPADHRDCNRNKVEKLKDNGAHDLTGSMSIGLRLLRPGLGLHNGLAQPQYFRIANTERFLDGGPDVNLCFG